MLKVRSATNVARAGGRGRGRASKLNIIIIAYPVGSANNTKSCHLCADNRLKKMARGNVFGVKRL